MTDQKNNTPYFDVFRAIYRGGLSLWLNRRALLPMTLIPTVVTFLTIMIMRGAIPDDTSTFMLALIQIPSDFMTGLLCGLVIFIIMNAPRKGDRDTPVMFVLNITERKDLLFKAAGIHMIVGYLASGIYAVSEMISKPITSAVDNGAEPIISMDVTLIVLAIICLAFYGVRLLLLPILIMSPYDIKEFFLQKKSIGLSFPVFIVKAISAIMAGLLAIMIMGLFQSGGDDVLKTSPIYMGIVDFAISWLSVMATVWCYASLTVGFRQMMEGNVKP